MLPVGSPQARGLLAWFPLNGALGSALVEPTCRDLVRGVELTRQKTGTWNAAYYDGQFGPTPFVNHNEGTGWQAAVGAYLYNLNPPLTLACWFKLHAAAIGTNRALVCATTGGAYLRVTATPKLDFIKSETADILAGNTTLSADVWYHGAVTYGDGTVTLYLNGLPDGSGSSSQTFSSAGQLGIGRGSDQALIGSICDVRLYNRALGPGEIWQMYAPETRWELYRLPGRMLYAAAAGAGNPWYSYAQQ